MHMPAEAIPGQMQDRERDEQNEPDDAEQLHPTRCSDICFIRPSREVVVLGTFVHIHHACLPL